MPIASKTVKVGTIGLPRAEREALEALSPKAAKATRTERLTSRATDWTRNIEELPVNIPGLLYSVKGQLPAGKRSFKLVGTGSYTEAALYVTIEREGRERLRGTCQACGGQQVVADGRIVLHGYQRPGLGWINGRCMGTGYEPAEHNVALTGMTIKACREAAVEARAALANAPKLDRLTRWDDPEYKRQRGLEQRARANEQHAEFLAQSVLPRLGQALTTEVVA